MTLTELMRRAQAHGCVVHSSGPVRFISNGTVTIKITTHGTLHRRNNAGTDWHPQAITTAQASKLLGLPRR
jgi:hypothetical protein